MNAIEAAPQNGHFQLSLVDESRSPRTVLVRKRRDGSPALSAPPPFSGKISVESGDARNDICSGPQKQVKDGLVRSDNMLARQLYVLVADLMQLAVSPGRDYTTATLDA
eukprot:6190618-Pleurochrysis_carterae.AAC.1